MRTVEFLDAVRLLRNPLSSADGRGIFVIEVFCTDCPQGYDSTKPVQRRQMSTLHPFCQVLTRSISLAPEEGPDKYLNMAQLHEGREALEFYHKGLAIMQKQLGNGDDNNKRQHLKQRLCIAYCSVGELFLTDLCFEEDAEKRCQARQTTKWVVFSRPYCV